MNEIERKSQLLKKAVLSGKINLNQFEAGFVSIITKEMIRQMSEYQKAISKYQKVKRYERD